MVATHGTILGNIFFLSKNTWGQTGPSFSLLPLSRCGGRTRINFYSGLREKPQSWMKKERRVRPATPPQDLTLGVWRPGLSTAGASINRLELLGILKEMRLGRVSWCQVI